MEKTAIADEPEITLPTCYDAGDPAKQSPATIVAIMREPAGGWIKPVEAAFFHTNPQITVSVASDAGKTSVTDAVGVARIVAIGRKPFSFGIEFAHPASLGGDP